MVTMALLLTLPVDSRAVQAFVRKFLWWSTFQVRTDTGLASPGVLCPPGLLSMQPWQNTCDTADTLPCSLHEWTARLQGLLCSEICLAFCPETDKVSCRGR